jgi:hypothetical protein
LQSQQTYNLAVARVTFSTINFIAMNIYDFIEALCQLPMNMSIFRYVLFQSETDAIEQFDTQPLFGSELTWAVKYAL